VLKGLLSFHGFRADVEKSREIAQEMLRLADAQNDPSMRVDAYLGMGSSVAFAGDLELGLEYLDRGIETFETHRFQPRRLQLGIDPRIASLTTSGFLLALLGRPDSALVRPNRAIALAEELEHPYSIGYALYHAGYLHSWRREPELVRDRARSILQLVAVHDLPLWRALGTCLLGAATSELGDPIEGLRLVDEGLSWYQDLRTPPVFWPMIRFLQAGVNGRAGKATEARAAVDEAVTLAGENSILTPSFVIGRADLLLLLDPTSIDEATDSYEDAAKRAAGYKARLPQLQATTRLVRIARSHAERAARVASLRSIYGEFTEGFTTRDLVDAAQLLEVGRSGSAG
jgi:hypothetical protein